MIRRRDLGFLAALWAAQAVLLWPTLFGGRTSFMYDLTHINHPWRALVAEQLQRGMLPLWNPYSYFGLPLLGNFQTGLFHPLSVLFHCLPFGAVLGWFLWLVHGTAALWTYLWLRRLRLGRWACFGGAALFSIGGYMVAYDQFPNLVAALSSLPALFLFTGRAGPAAVTSALALLAGYPTNWAGITGVWAALGWLWHPGRRTWTACAAATAAALALCACVLVPGFELSRTSGRVKGIHDHERFMHSLKPFELWTLVHPELARAVGKARERPSPNEEKIRWEYKGVVRTFKFYTDGREDPIAEPGGIKYMPHKASYLGVVGALLALAGLGLVAAASPAGAALLGGFSLLVTVLLLGGHTAVSKWLWLALPPLNLVRGPARLSYLLYAPAVPLAAFALHRLARKKSWAAAGAALALTAELMAAGWAFYPTMPRAYWALRGELVDFLAAGLEGLRFHQVPVVEAWPLMYIPTDQPDWDLFKTVEYESYREKLYGISNAPFHFEAASGAYEPLVPAASERAIEILDRDADAEALSRRMRWAGVKYTLERRKTLDKSRDFEARGSRLWRVYETKKPAHRARLLPGEGEDLADDLERAGEPFGQPLDARRPREDRVELEGTSDVPATVFLTEPFYPGWEVWVNGQAAAARRSLGAFVSFPVPEGTWKAVYLYRPAFWLWGLWISLAAWVSLAAYGKDRLRESLNP